MKIVGAIFEKFIWKKYPQLVSDTGPSRGMRRDEAPYIVDLWITRTQADHAWSTITVANEMKWNETKWMRWVWKKWWNDTKGYRDSVSSTTNSTWSNRDGNSRPQRCSGGLASNRLRHGDARPTEIYIGYLWKLWLWFKTGIFNSWFQ